MCSPWEEAAQPQGERREAGAEAVSISECPREEKGGGGPWGDMGSLAGKESILNPSCSSHEGTQSFTPALSPPGQGDAGRAGCIPFSP